MAVTPNIEHLVGRELSSVEFVRDYIQLRFDGPCLSIYNVVVVTSTAGSLSDQQSGFRDSLVRLIGCTVLGARVEPDEALTLSFAGGESLRVSLKPENYVFGPEAAVLTIADTSWVW